MPWILWILRFLNIANAVLLGISAFESFFIIDGSATRAFLMIYQALFGVLLLLFELRLGPVARWIKRQFGFMFTFSGRLVFLVFVGAVTFGMIHTRPSDVTDSTSWQYSSDWVTGVGIATMTNAVINAFVICSHPYFRSDPRSQMTDEEVERYLKEHPEALAKASAKPSAAAASAPVAASSTPDFTSSAGYTPPAPVAAPSPAPDVASGSGFYGSADGGAGADDVDPFSAAPAPAAAPAAAAGDGNPFDDDDDNPFA